MLQYLKANQTSIHTYSNIRRAVQADYTWWHEQVRGCRLLCSLGLDNHDRVGEDSSRLPATADNREGESHVQARTKVARSHGCPFGDVDSLESCRSMRRLTRGNLVWLRDSVHILLARIDCSFLLRTEVSFVSALHAVCTYSWHSSATPP